MRIARFGGFCGKLLLDWRGFRGFVLHILISGDVSEWSLLSGGDPIAWGCFANFRACLAGRSCPFLPSRLDFLGGCPNPFHIRLSKIAARFPSICSHYIHLLLEIVLTIAQNYRQVIHILAFNFSKVGVTGRRLCVAGWIISNAVCSDFVRQI